MLYGARTLAGCLVETLIRGRFQDTAWPQPITERELRTRRVARLRLHARPLRAIELFGAALLRLGGDARLHSEVPYTTPEAWARAAHRHPAQPDGILYPARFDATCLCAALFDRAANAIAGFDDEGPVYDHPDFPAAVARYELTIV